MTKSENLLTLIIIRIFTQSLISFIFSKTMLTKNLLSCAHKNSSFLAKRCCLRFLFLFWFLKLCVFYCYTFKSLYTANIWVIKFLYCILCRIGSHINYYWTNFMLIPGSNILFFVAYWSSINSLFCTSRFKLLAYIIPRVLLIKIKIYTTIEREDSIFGKIPRVSSLSLLFKHKLAWPFVLRSYCWKISLRVTYRFSPSYRLWI